MSAVLFLDIDGVLITERSHYAADNGRFMKALDPVGAGMLSRLCRSAKAEVVLSSSWRTETTPIVMATILTNSGWVGDVPWHTCWKTPESRKMSGSRGDEIAHWMRDNGRPERFVIIDDDNDMLEEHAPHLVLTNFDEGVTWERLKLAAKILGVKHP